MTETLSAAVISICVAIKSVAGRLFQAGALVSHKYNASTTQPGKPGMIAPRINGFQSCKAD